jgi:protein-S-isoprenylcysteine O-methyltransferase Ste14
MRSFSLLPILTADPEDDSVPKKIMPTTYLLIALVAIILLHFLAPIGMIIPSPLNFIGLLLLVPGVVLNLLADRAFKENNTTVKPFDESSVLVTDGVFRISRHPMYLGFVLVLLGVAVLLGSVSPYPVILVFAILMDVGFIRMEESMLEAQFPGAWQDYKSRVRRWI